MSSSTDPRAGITVVAPGVNRSLLFDREGNLWMGESDIQRISRHELRSGSPVNPSHFQPFSTADGLTGLVNSFFEDREGNIWVATEGGLDRFSASNIVKVEMPPKAYVPALAAADAGAVWMTYLSSPTSGGIKIIRGSTLEDVPIRLDDGYSYAYRDPDGSMWFGGVKSLLHVQGERHSIVKLPVYSDLSGVRAIVRDRAGGLWVSSAVPGLFRFFEGRWSANGELPTLPRVAPIVATVDPAGRLWFGYTKSRVARVEGSSVRMFGPADGLDLGNIKAFEMHGQDIWVAGERGLARLNDQRFVKIRGSNDEAFTGISGLVTRANGDLWANGHMGLIHIQRDELDHARRDPSYPVQYESFNYLDGLPGAAQQVFPLPSLIEGTDGRLWLSLHGDKGVAWIDPDNIYRNSLPPPVSILSVSSAGRRFAATPDILRLPIGTTSLQIQYMAGSLSIPERVHFRYRLEGSDSGWQDADNRREAFYTNLAPGAYTFRVIAANNDGVWNNAGASIQLFIRPAFYQTRWFHAACILAFLLLLLALHRVRLKAVRAESLARLEERLAERERIARELHDTLLQSVQGLMLRFQAASERLPQHEPARLQMESALVRAETVMNEGRKRVKNLRTVDSSAKNFVEALTATGELYAQNSAARFHAGVEGAQRDLHPIVQEEVLLIAREALANAFRHAQARTIETQLRYNSTELQVRICDDGVGINTDILNHGRPGHWGLAGMHERAKNIGARLTISSEPAGGTAVELRIPADVVYQSEPRRTQKPFWRTEHKL